MTVADPGAAAAALPPVDRIRRHQWLATAGQAVRTPRGATGLGLVSFVVAVAVIGPFVAPDPPDALLTYPFREPSGQFLLGGDFLGRDVLLLWLGRALRAGRDGGPGGQLLLAHLLVLALSDP